MRTALALTVAVAACIAGTGCARPLQPVHLETGKITPAVDYTALDKVLSAAVNDDGLVIPTALDKKRDVLEDQLKLLAVTGPSSTPELLVGREERLAYWYNARAAWSIYLLGECDCPDQLRRRDLARPFPLDGRMMTLDQIDAQLSDYDDWRIMAAAPGASLDRAPLPRQAMRAGDFDAVLAERISTFIDDPQRVEIDIAAREVRMPPVLWNMRDRIITDYQQRYNAAGANLLTALMPATTGSANRRLQDAIGYDIAPQARKPLAAVIDQTGIPNLRRF
jgi:hypothetical protein